MDAIDQQHLAPLLYFGIHDGVDLTDIPWRRGQGYGIEALTNRYTSSNAWGRLVIKQVTDQADFGSMRGLGFCVSTPQGQRQGVRKMLDCVGSPATCTPPSPPPSRRSPCRRPA